MKNLVVSILFATVLCACGGGNGGSGPTQPAPSVKVLSSAISRNVVAGTPVSVVVAIQPSFSPSGTLYATATDKTGTFAPSVSVHANSDGSYSLTLMTSTTAATGNVANNLTLNLCSDAACTMPQAVPSITVPFSVNVMSSTSVWPGNNLTTLSAWPGAPDWSMFQGNAAHTGFVPVTVDPNQFTPRWETAYDNNSISSYGLSNTLTTANGLFYFSGFDFQNTGSLYAQKEFDGSAAWQYSFASLPYPTVNPPSVANGTIYIAVGAQQYTYLFGFDANNGAVKFKSLMSSQWEHFLAPTIGPVGIYTDGGSYGGLYGFGVGGQQLFSSGTAQADMWTPAVDAAGVYTYVGGVLKVADPQTGSVLHSISDPSFTNYVYAIGGAPVLGAPGSVFVANYANAFLNGGAIGNTLTNFNTVKNSIAWQVKGSYPSTPAYASGVLYTANNNPVRLEARAETDGSLLWSWTPPLAGDTNFASEVLLTNNLAFVSTNLSTYAIDLNSHQTVWSFPLSARLALSKNRVLYLQSSAYLATVNLK